MSNLVRILVIIACILALYYLVVTLARSVAEEDLGLLHCCDSSPAVARLPTPSFAISVATPSLISSSSRFVSSR
jgi:hypothetical protein